MSDFGETWRLIRGRFDDTVRGLSQDQLNYRMQPGSLTVGEMAFHVAGAEVSFTSQLQGETLAEDLARLSAASTDGVINDRPFPYSPAEITSDRVEWALAAGRAAVEPLIDDLGSELRQRQIKSVLGPMIDGTGAFARLAYHPGYHQGQAYLVKLSPGFPRQ